MSGSILDKYSGRRKENGDSHGTSETIPADDTGLDTESDAIAENLGCFGWHRGTRDFPRMLELRKKDGDIVAIAYAYIDRVEFDCSGIVTLHAHGRKVIIKGRNLNTEVRPGVRLLQGIARQRVGWLQEDAHSDTIVENIKTHGPVITSIVF